MPTITTRLTFAYTAVFALIIAIVMATIYSRFSSGLQLSLDRELSLYTDFLLSEVGSPQKKLEATFEQMRKATSEASLRFPSLRLALLNRDTVVYEQSRRVPIGELLDSLR